MARVFSGADPHKLSATIEVTDVHLVALRMLVDRRDELSKARMQAANRLHGRRSELVPGQAERDVTTGQANPKCASSAAILGRGSALSEGPATGRSSGIGSLVSSWRVWLRGKTVPAARRGATTRWDRWT